NDDRADQAGHLGNPAPLRVCNLSLLRRRTRCAVEGITRGSELPRWAGSMLLGLRRRWDDSAWHVALLLAVASCAAGLLVTVVGPIWPLILAGLTVLAILAAAYSTRRQADLRHAEMRQFLETLCGDDLDETAQSAALSLD